MDTQLCLVTLVSIAIHVREITSCLNRRLRSLKFSLCVIFGTHVLSSRILLKDQNQEILPQRKIEYVNRITFIRGIVEIC